MCPSAPAGGRRTCAPCSPTSSRNARTAAGPRPCGPGTTPPCLRDGRRRGGDPSLDDPAPAHRAGEKTPGMSRSRAPGPARGSRPRTQAPRNPPLCRRRAELAADRHRLRAGVQGHHRRHLRVRVLRRCLQMLAASPMRRPTAGRCGRPPLPDARRHRAQHRCSRRRSNRTAARRQSPCDHGELDNALSLLAGCQPGTSARSRRRFSPAIPTCPECRRAFTIRSLLRRSIWPTAGRRCSSSASTACSYRSARRACARGDQP